MWTTLSNDLILIRAMLSEKNTFSIFSETLSSLNIENSNGFLQEIEIWILIVTLEKVEIHFLMRSDISQNWSTSLCEHRKNNSACTYQVINNNTYYNLLILTTVKTFTIYLVFLKWKCETILCFFNSSSVTVLRKLHFREVASRKTTDCIT